jgi:hypothetical protein
MLLWASIGSTFPHRREAWKKRGKEATKLQDESIFAMFNSVTRNPHTIDVEVM